MTIEPHAPGVYLSLSHEAYLRDPSLGYSALKVLKADPPEWWETSAWNPLRPPESEDEKLGFMLGTAFHLMLLEGIDLYEEAYGIVPTKADFPEHLDTIKELQRELRDRGQSVTGLKEELVDRLHRIAPDLPILDLEVRAFREACKRPISRRHDSVLRRLWAMAMATPEDIKLLHGEVTTLQEAFTGGPSEVSVFWVDDNDVPMRARFDKLKPNASLDLKTFAKWDATRDFRQSLLKEIKHRGYWMQVAHYHEARVKLREFVAAGLVYGGTDSQRAYLEEVAAAEEWTWVWVFAKTTGAPRIKAIPGHADNLRFTRAQQDREEAIGQFIAHRAQFGMDLPWLDIEAIWDPDEDEWSEADFI